MADMVSVELCDAKMANIDTKLDGISGHVDETREGVATLNRRLFEGNGSIALDNVIRANAEFRLQQQKREESRRRWALTRNLAWMVAGAGWVVAIAIYLLQS